MKAQKFILVVGGTNLKLSKALGKNIVNKSRLSVSYIIAKSSPPHNGCPTKIRKRKKNKGRNRRIKRFLNTTNKRLPTTKEFTNSSILKNYSDHVNMKSLKEKLTRIAVKKPRNSRIIKKRKFITNRASRAS